MIYASISHRSNGTVSVEEHVKELLTAAGEAAAAGDGELAGMLRSHARLVEAQPSAAAGSATMVRRDGTRFKLGEVRANIRRGVQTRGNKVQDLAKINATFREIAAIEREESKPRRGRPGGNPLADQLAVLATLRAMQNGTFGVEPRRREPTQLELQEQMDRIGDEFSDDDFE